MENECERLFNEAMKILDDAKEKLKQMNPCICKVPMIMEYKEGRFPAQDKSLATIRSFATPMNILQVHDDGDLTIEAGGKRYVVTIEGGIFAATGLDKKG
jgi:hypothetical protein